MGKAAMLKSRPVIAFVATRLPRRAKAFYGNTLGLKLVSEDVFALVFDAGGTMLRIATVPEHEPAGYTVLGWLVRDIERSVHDLRSKGVSFNVYDGMGQDEHDIWSAPSGARVAWFTDPDGNTLSLTGIARTKPHRSSARKAAARPIRKSKAKAARTSRQR